MAINPRLVYCSISAFGQTGPYANKPGFDTLGQAVSGLLSLLTDPDEPKVMGMALSDYVTGLSAGYGILGALLGARNPAMDAEWRRRCCKQRYPLSARRQRVTCEPVRFPIVWPE